MGADNTGVFDWKFINDPQKKGFFKVENPFQNSRAYFPLFNLDGMMSATTAEFKGDLKIGQNAFFSEPQVTENLAQTKNSRNFWIRTDKGKVASLTGVSVFDMARRAECHDWDKNEVLAGPGFFTLKRHHPDLNCDFTSTLFVPVKGTFEVALYTIKNTGTLKLTFQPFAVQPVYARSADNLRDHRQVTTLLNRVTKNDHGVIVTPVMSFDERGHKEGELQYSVHGVTTETQSLKAVMADLESFIGEGGSLEAPEKILHYTGFRDDFPCLDGRQAVAALEFQTVTLSPGEEISFGVVCGIHGKSENVMTLMQPLNSVSKIRSAFDETVNYWQSYIDRLNLKTGDTQFDHWMAWVAMQPVMRRVFGCSFLPDFGYGRGGRGWRDLWQDCLGLLLTQPAEVKEILLNNIQGVRLDGSNATIIGSKPGEFVADRNNIPRTWMDHGVWPFLTIALYMEQTGDLDILMEKRPFFRDRLVMRCKELDSLWKKDEGCFLTDNSGNQLKNPIIAHLIIQNLTQFFNRGDHGNVRLEDADWNDGLDMAHEKGESVPFTCFYGWNLIRLAEYLQRLETEKGIHELELPNIWEPLISCPESTSLDILKTTLKTYLVEVKERRYHAYRKYPVKELIQSLSSKGQSLCDQVKHKEFIKTPDGGYFNGYYNNQGERLEGVVNGSPQMTLTAQVFPVMSGAATQEQVEMSYASAMKLLRDPDHGGYRLNTDFGKMMLNMGRAFSFSYGDKENGAVFSHMAVMFANALLKRNFVREGTEVLLSLYKMASNVKNSKIYPCVPEYFNRYGRGLYCYITGSGAWYVMTLLTEVFGVKGIRGCLGFFPKLDVSWFAEQTSIEISTLFHNKKITVRYHNAEKREFKDYKVLKVELNKGNVKFMSEKCGVSLPADLILQDNDTFDITLG